MMCYEIYYANEKDQIPRCEDLHDAAKLNQKVQQEGYKLDIKTLKDNDIFQEFLKLWLEPCIQSMREADGKNWDTETLFFKETDVKAGTEFCEALCNCVLGFEPYKQDGNGVAGNPYDDIEKDINAHMSKSEEYLKLRVMAVCIFLALEPKDVFSTGEKWWLGFSDSEKSTVAVSNGQTFVIHLENITELWPNELSNPGAEACTINVTYGEKTYEVAIPPRSSISAVFADQECTRLVNLKSNLFAVSVDANQESCAIGARTGGKLFLCQSGKEYEMKTAAAILDAAPDGNGSFSVLYDYGVGFLGTGELIEEKPIRVYGAGDLWIWQYKDQTLRSKGEGLPQKAVSIVVEADGTTRIWDGDSARKYEKGYSEGGVLFSQEEIAEEEFVKFMMAPFCGSYCDSICVDRASISIDRGGKICQQ